jgi:hypothetical protein
VNLSKLRIVVALASCALCLAASADDTTPQLPFANDGTAVTSKFNLDTLQSSVVGTAMEPAVKLLKEAQGYCKSIGKDSATDLPICINTLVDSTVKNLGANKVLVPQR